jgi:uncharacterized Zn-binding protein involved in type VI secretion
MGDAARLGDDHTCPKSNWFIYPHKGGPVAAPGEPHVLIEGSVAARFTDTATCIGALDAVAEGSPTVFIGGMLAARKGDATEHEGAISNGAATVQIGFGPPGISMVRRGKVWLILDTANHTLTIVGLQEFAGPGASQAYVDKATGIINQTWSGTTTINGEPYTVTSMVQGRQQTADSQNPSANRVDVAHTTEPPDVTSDKDPSHQALYGNGPGYQHDTDCDQGDLTPAHEFGHSMGLDDEYTEYPHKSGEPRNIVHTGPPGGLMGYTDPGSKPTPQNYQSLVGGHGLCDPRTGTPMP